MNVLKRLKVFIFITSAMVMGNILAMNQPFIQVTNYGHGNITTIVVNNLHSNPIVTHDPMDIEISDDEMDVDVAWLNQASAEQGNILTVSSEAAPRVTANCVDLSQAEDTTSDNEGIVDARTIEPLKCSMCQTEYEDQDFNMDISCCQGYHVFCTPCITDWKRTKNTCPTPGCVKTLDHLISNNHTQSYLEALQRSLAQDDVRKINVLKFFLKKKQNQTNTSVPRVVVNLDEQIQSNLLRNMPRASQRSSANNRRIRVINGQASNPIVIESNHQVLSAPRLNRFFRLNNVVPDVQEIIVIEDDVVNSENNRNVSENNNNNNVSTSVNDASDHGNTLNADKTVNHVEPAEKHIEPTDNSLLSSVKSTVQSYCVIS